MRFIPLLCVLLPALTACYSGESDSLRAPVSNEGVSVTIQANLPAGLLQANVAASYFQDGRKAALVGGDIIVAESDTDSSILRSLQNLSGDYSTVVDFSDATAGIEFAVDFDPVAARADRWYPVDELLVDPGPGELVGYRTQVAFPEAIVLSSPLSNEIYTTRSQEIVLSWTSSPDTEQTRFTSVQTCFSGSREVQWGTSDILSSADPGSHTVSVGELIPSTNFITQVTNTLSALSVIIVGSILETYSFGLIGRQDIKIETFDLEYCTLSLTVFREVGNDLGADISGGFAIGSTSDTVTVEYRP
ncbi:MULTISPECIES: hypothetical protein [unclassified Ketobacter]|uniref:hypothetical protein n=1 Tax=unclassified Ketobacter TaxID=2639109 RepID=UPI000F0D98E1|nr:MULTISPECIES: hypothetical protein [unclassified Ketobacter]RLT89067.1 MAG: hypothetical protein D9N13_18150 [Ketobacter sp. GenoA1]RLT97207.1 MAG: hypothetical protein D9N15_09530 [Ketobacter sp.]